MIVIQKYWTEIKKANMHGKTLSGELRRPYFSIITACRVNKIITFNTNWSVRNNNTRSKLFQTLPEGTSYEKFYMSCVPSIVDSFYLDSHCGRKRVMSPDDLDLFQSTSWTINVLHLFGKSLAVQKRALTKLKKISVHRQDGDWGFWSGTVVRQRKTHVGH